MMTTIVCFWLFRSSEVNSKKFCWGIFLDMQKHFDVYCFPGCIYLFSTISYQRRSLEVWAPANRCLRVKWASIVFQLRRMLLINLEVWTGRRLLEMSIIRSIFLSSGANVNTGELPSFAFCTCLGTQRVCTLLISFGLCEKEVWSQKRATAILFCVSECFTFFVALLHWLN